MPFKLECRRCAGLGFIYPYRERTCPVCKGNFGIVLPGEPGHYADCRRCNGLGYYYPHKGTNCDTCGGYGVVRVATPAKPPEPPAVLENAILERLHAILPSSAASYRQALIDLRDTSRLSVRGTALELRETLRELLDQLAPTDQVETAPWFEYEDGQSKPTMRQKARFILRSRRSPDAIMLTTEDSVALIEEHTSSLVRNVYRAASLPTHVASSRATVLQLKRYIDSVLAELLDLQGVQ